MAFPNCQIHFYITILALVLSYMSGFTHTASYSFTAIWKSSINKLLLKERTTMVKLGGQDDSFISYRTGQYKLHYYETPTNVKFVILTDVGTLNMRNVLHQIYVNLYVEYVIKNPLSPVEHKSGKGVANELFELALDQFVKGLL
ncbi:Trafficking protein particle complex subunit 1 [Erysiphe necator]|nr:Trafficking protein particle complex subunit 1 [Erysiphe necator]